MRAQNLNSPIFSIGTTSRIFTFFVCLVFFSSCKKEVADMIVTTNNKPLRSIQPSAVTFNWETSAPVSEKNTLFTLEADNSGNRFLNPIDIRSTTEFSLALSVEELNTYIRRLIAADKMSRVEFRLRISKAGSETFTYSEPIALDVTPYQPFVNYEDKQVFRVPGNFQNWAVATAPEVVTTNNDGLYEGYINFTNPYSQFLLVKGAPKWTTTTTFQYIGGSKFGYSGSMFSLFDGAGIYRVQLNTNTNTWVCTRIKMWGLTGSSVAGEAGMVYDAEAGTWSITKDMLEGDFTIRANNDNAIRFGHNASSDTGVPDYNGTGIHIKSAGNYTIILKLLNAGNYSYSVQKNG
jgi:hypothetical protein